MNFKVLRHAALMLTISLLALTTISMTNKAQTLKSKAELTDYAETSRYADVMAFIGELQKKSDFIRVEYFARTDEGRDLPLLILSKPAVRTPLEAAASGKTVVFIQANIHAGEVEGKEAMLHLSRRILTGDLAPLLNNLIILVAPIYNADGNEKISVNNRTAQNGPVNGVGTRENSKRLDLNRDYMKLESLEARGLVGLFTRWDPALIVDLHTTNGSYHGYHLTYSPMLNPNADRRLINFERVQMLPAITRTLKLKHGFRTYYYGNFTTRDAVNYEVEEFTAKHEGKEKIWRTFDHRPRFGNNYAGLRNRLTILSEAYSYLDFKKRVAVTEAFVEEILKFSALNALAIRDLVKAVDASTIKGATAGKALQQGLEFEIKPLAKPVPILIGEVEKKKNPISGKMMTAMIEDKITPTSMLDFGVFEPKRSLDLPAGYLFANSKGLSQILENLRQHGIVCEELTSPAEVEVEAFEIEKSTRATREFQGHRAITIKGKLATRAEKFPAGTVLIRTAQPLGRLAFYLLEAESDDGLLSWNFLDDFLGDGKTYPIYRLKKAEPLAARIIK